jgi:hypothetical protein
MDNGLAITLASREIKGIAARLSQEAMTQELSAELRSSLFQNSREGRGIKVIQDQAALYLPLVMLNAGRLPPSTSEVQGEPSPVAA